MNNTISRHTDGPALEMRLAARLAGGLTLRAEGLPHDVSERLRFAREQAVARARLARQPERVAAGQAVVLGRGGSATLGGFVPWWQRAVSMLPVMALVLGLVAIDRLSTREQVLAAADIDAQLLSDQLPPAAYSDPGFAEFLRSASPP
jgi:hypothetical protein